MTIYEAWACADESAPQDLTLITEEFLIDDVNYRIAQLRKAIWCQKRGKQ